MEILYKDYQVNWIAGRLGLNKNLVDLIINNYVHILRDKISRGETVKFLGICYLRVSQKDLPQDRETLAYVSTEIAKAVQAGNETVLRVLETLEELISYELKENKGFSIRGLVRLRVVDGVVKVKKSTTMNGQDIYATVLGSFRRKMVA